MLMWWLLPCCLLLSCCASPFSSGNVAFVRTRSTTSVCLLHGLVLLPCGISGKMTLPSKSLLSLLASCFVLSLCCATYHLLPCLPYCHVKPLTHLPSKLLFGYVTALLSPSYSVVSCRWRWRLFHVGTCLSGITQYLKISMSQHGTICNCTYN